MKNIIIQTKYISDNYKSQIAHIDNNLYNRYANRAPNNTNNISNNINQYTTDVVNNYKINKGSYLKNTYHNFTGDVVINKRNTIYTNDNINVTNINKLVNLSDSNYLYKETRT